MTKTQQATIKRILKNTVKNELKNIFNIDGCGFISDGFRAIKSEALSEYATEQQDDIINQVNAVFEDIREKSNTCGYITLKTIKEYIKTEKIRSNNPHLKVIFYEYDQGKYCNAFYLRDVLEIIGDSYIAITSEKSNPIFLQGTKGSAILCPIMKHN